MYYQVVSHTGSGVVLLREDGSKFEHDLKGAAAPAIGSLFEIPDPPPEGVAVSMDDEITLGNDGETGVDV